MKILICFVRFFEDFFHFLSFCFFEGLSNQFICHVFSSFLCFWCFDILVFCTIHIKKKKKKKRYFIKKKKKKKKYKTYKLLFHFFNCFLVIWNFNFIFAKERYLFWVWCGAFFCFLFFVYFSENWQSYFVYFIIRWFIMIWCF